jgi:hypothetical protein
LYPFGLDAYILVKNHRTSNINKAAVFKSEDSVQDNFLNKQESGIAGGV